MIAKERAKAALKASKSSTSGEKRKMDEAALQVKSSGETRPNLVGELDEVAKLEVELQPKKKKTKKEKRENSGRKRKERKDKTRREHSIKSSED